MEPSDPHADKTLPVTAEVGDEGGSYADPTVQAETFSGPAGNARVDSKAAEAGVKSPAIRSERQPPGKDDEFVKQATEQPDNG